MLAGLALSLVSGLPRIVISPDLIFLIFLPSLLYQAAWTMSYHQYQSSFPSRQPD
ncbi:hypothetical protein [Hymenobacter rigui]|uniref:hypothetical protein n=1 Tax=Hymenobacter rigui TaxID=334424 RepID=UPI0014772C06|nr:hypothetical protein [Hymenobacter rigui]